jgi:superfamily II RNA helicase
MVLTTDNNNYSNDSKYGEYFKLFQHDLSPFQKHAIQGIVDGNHVLVTAATGSGKTLPAEFAIRHFTGLGKRVIYCSPIKALSNQKTFDFTQKYPDITFGLLTGDIKTNPSAQVLIMTTEILMNQLFTQSENRKDSSLSFSMDIENELGCVVFDEFHYINDAHRGHVWEQTILMMPQHVQMVMLSATLDDPVKSARWIEARSDLKLGDPKLGDPLLKQVVICSTDTRIVPLTHYVYMNGTEGFYKKMKDKETEAKFRKSVDKCLPIRSADGVFNESTYKETKMVLDALAGNDVQLKRKTVLNNLFAHLRDQDMLPAICFVFSRKAVEQCAEEIKGTDGSLMNPPLNDEHSGSSGPQVHLLCESILKRLPNWREYHGLPEYQNLVALLEKGIGIHHSGMIPVLREIVEFMISKKYIKVLFATESFAIGLDCPIKTAVFINLKKYDGGDSPRYLLPHEYTQMAGRAGRRGIDTVGHVVHCSNLFELPSMTTYKEVLCGKPQKLESKFQIYYSVVLNLFKNAEKVSVKDIEKFIAKSMLQTEMDKMSAGLLREVEDTEKKIEQKEQGFANLKTSRETLKTYSDLLVKQQFSANKKRKEIDISIRKMFAENPNLEKDYVFYIDYLKFQKTLDEIRLRLHANQNYILDKVVRLMRVLVDVGVIQMISEDEYTLVAGVVSEINPILVARISSVWNNFEDFEPKDLVAFFSLFTDVRVNEECRIYPGFSNYCDQPFMNEKIKNFEKVRSELLVLEESYGIHMKDTGLDGLCYDLIDCMYAWCECTNEAECKSVISEIEANGVSIGDFTKAILKISTLGRELMGTTTSCVELAHKLSQIDGLILKYVATNQSLYL